MGIFPFLDAVLKENNAQAALEASYQVDETPDDLTKWIEDNLLDVYDGPEVARAYDFLANADVWLGRVRATQNYSYWRYAADNTAAGVAAARDGTKGGWTRYGRPQFWPSSNKTADEVCQQIAERGGMSIGIARRSVLPFLSAMTHHCKPRELTVKMAAAYEFDESHVSFITGSGESTNKVQSIVEDAQQLREDAIEANAGGAFAGSPSNTDGEAESTDSASVSGDDTAVDEDEATGASEEPTHTAPDENNENDDDQAGLSDFF